MILGELFGRVVTDAAGHRVGQVADVRLVLPKGTRTGPARVHGLLVGRGAHPLFLGFERTGARSPWPVAQLVRRRQRDSFLVLWSDVAEVRADRVVLRAGAARWSTDLPGL